MNVRMDRTLKQADYLAELKATFGSLEALQRIAKAEPRRRGLAEEWKHFLAHPERNDEILTVSRELVFHDFEKFLEVITPQRLRMLDYLRAHPNVDSLSELAKGLGRDYRNVHEDAKRLASTGVLELEEKSNRVVPRVLAQRIEVTI